MPWEYKVDTLDVSGVFVSGNVDPRETAMRLNTHALNGWELVTSYPVAQAHGNTALLVFIYKRPRAEPTPPPVQFLEQAE